MKICTNEVCKTLSGDIYKISPTNYKKDRPYWHFYPTPRSTFFPFFLVLILSFNFRQKIYGPKSIYRAKYIVMSIAILSNILGKEGADCLISEGEENN